MRFLCLISHRPGLDKLQLSNSPADPESGKLSANGHQKTLWKGRWISTRGHTHMLAEPQGDFNSTVWVLKGEKDRKELNKPRQCLTVAANGGWEQFSFVTFHPLRLWWKLGQSQGGYRGVKKTGINGPTLMLTSTVTLNYPSLASGAFLHPSSSPYFLLQLLHLH